MERRLGRSKWEEKERCDGRERKDGRKKRML